MAGGGVKINNISVRGGANGKTPRFKIEDGNLYNTYQDGENPNWNNLGRVKGADGTNGRDGASGAKLVSQVLQGQDENGGNIYLQTFDDGTTATFTAPKGDTGGSVVSVSATGTATEEVSYITIDGVEKKLSGSGGGGSGDVASVNGKTGVVVLDADDISDAGTDNKFVSQSDIAHWNGKSVVSVSATGTATEEISYITINGTQKKIAGGAESINYTTDDDINSLFN